MKKRKGSPWLLIFLCCVLAVPTVGVLMGLVPPDVTPEAAKPALLVGALLGVAHLVLRLIFAPLGCLTLGLFGLVIDVGLIYFSAEFVQGFRVPSFLYALLTALLINAVCAVAAGRK